MALVRHAIWPLLGGSIRVMIGGFLSVMNDTAQKTQYEDRLKRIYEEKDIVITQCHQLQNDVKLLQEKFLLQAEQYQNSIAQYNASHEQSENRWAKMIDQARDATKDAYKKLENFR